MNTNPTVPPASGDKPSQTGGTPEETSLTVKLLGQEWIVENALGESVGSAQSQEKAVEIARALAPAEKASAVAVLGSDGTVERTVTV